MVKVRWLKLAQSMQASGLKTGLFVSPHISCFHGQETVNISLTRIRILNKFLTYARKKIYHRRFLKHNVCL